MYVAATITPVRLLCQKNPIVGVLMNPDDSGYPLGSVTDGGSDPSSPPSGTYWEIFSAWVGDAPDLTRSDRSVTIYSSPTLPSGGGDGGRLAHIPPTIGNPGGAQLIGSGSQGVTGRGTWHQVWSDNVLLTPRAELRIPIFTPVGDRITFGVVGNQIPMTAGMREVCLSNRKAGAPLGGLVGPNIPGNTTTHYYELGPLSNFDSDNGPTVGHSWRPVAPEVNVHTGAYTGERHATIIATPEGLLPDESVDTILARTGPIYAPSVPNHEGSGSYTPQGTGPADWKYHTEFPHREMLPEDTLLYLATNACDLDIVSFGALFLEI